MQQKHVLLGVGAAASRSALIGTGAFTRVESQRDVTIQVAEGADAYFGLEGTGAANSDNYVDLDDSRHFEIHIADSGNGGQGVSSDSVICFDSVSEIINQGKEDVGFYIEPPRTLLDGDDRC